jgi:hypothetical protein
MVERYNIYPYDQYSTDDRTSPTGAWVRYEDYEALEAKLAKALGAMAINPWSIGHSEWKRHVNDTMAELKGEKNE